MFYISSLYFVLYNCNFVPVPKCFNTVRFQIILSLLLFAFPAIAQESLFDALHERGDSVSFSLDTDWKKLLRGKLKKEYQPVTVIVHGLGDPIHLKGKIRSRGNVRLEACGNPSLKLKVKKAGLRAAGFNDLNEFKFVLQCTNSGLGEDYLNREKLVYDLHKIYSDFYHRTISAQIMPLQDEGKVIKTFMVEDEEQLAERYKANILDTKRANTAGLERSSYVSMCLFNYYILNSDWHVYNLHNVEFVNPTGTTDLISIPYDFDYSGFVGTSYAIPRESLDISSIYTPVWLGKDVTEGELKRAAAHYQNFEDKARTLIQEYPNLDKRSRKRMLRRTDQFYELLANEKKLLRLLR